MKIVLMIITVKAMKIKRKKKFNNSLYQQLKDKIKEEKEVKCTLFFSKADFDKALDQASSYSGDLTSYR